jgi:hypothetical protein
MSSSLIKSVVTCSGCRNNRHKGEPAPIFVLELPRGHVPVRFISEYRGRVLQLQVPAIKSNIMRDLSQATAAAASVDPRQVVLAVVAGQEVTFFPSDSYPFSAIQPHNILFAFQCHEEGRLVHLRILARESSLTYKLAEPHVLRVALNATVEELRNQIDKVMQNSLRRRGRADQPVAEKYQLFVIGQNNQRRLLSAADGNELVANLPHSDEAEHSRPYISLQMCVHRDEKAAASSNGSFYWKAVTNRVEQHQYTLTLDHCLRNWVEEEEMIGQNKYRCDTAQCTAKRQEATKQLQILHSQSHGFATQPPPRYLCSSAVVCLYTCCSTRSADYPVQTPRQRGRQTV